MLAQTNQHRMLASRVPSFSSLLPTRFSTGFHSTSATHSVRQPATRDSSVRWFNKKNAREAWNAFMFEFRTVYRTQHPNASSADVMSAGREEWRNMAEDVMRDTQEEWRNVTEEKAPYHGGKAVKKNPDHDGSKAATDKGSKKAVNKGPEKTRATFREGYINRIGLRRSLLSRRSVPEVHRRGQPMKYYLPSMHTTGMR